MLYTKCLAPVSLCDIIRKMSSNVWLGYVPYSNILDIMENNKTLKPGQLATLKSKVFETRVIVRTSKKVTRGGTCFSCFLRNSKAPCKYKYLISVERCREMFGPDMFPIVVNGIVYEKSIFDTRKAITRL